MKIFKKGLAFLAIVGILFVSGGSVFASGDIYGGSVSVDSSNNWSVHLTKNGSPSAYAVAWLYKETDRSTLNQIRDNADNGQSADGFIDPGTYDYIVAPSTGYDCSDLAYYACLSLVNTTNSAYEGGLIYSPNPAFTGISILGGTAPSIGTPVDGTAFTSGTATAIQATLGGSGHGGLFDAVAVVGGIILALIIVVKITQLAKIEDHSHDKITK